MPFRANPALPGMPDGARQARRHHHWRFFACFAILAAFAPAQPGSQSTGQNIDRPYLLPEANRLPNANAQMKMREQQTKQQNNEAANAEQKKQLAEDSAKLLKLAEDLKAEVDKTNKDTLSLNVIRKANEIEKLAHSLRERMKSTIGAN